MLKDTDFEELLNLKELRAWEAFKSVCSGFLAYTRVPNFPSLYWEVAKVLRGYGVPNVTQDSFSPFPPQLLPAKPWSSEWWVWRKIPTRYYEDGEQLSSQMEPRHDGRPLQDALAWYTPGLLRKHIFVCLWYYELCNCVIQVYWFNQCSLSILLYLL